MTHKLHDKAINLITDHIANSLAAPGISETLSYFLNGWEIWNSSPFKYKDLVVDLLCLLTDPAISGKLSEDTRQEMPDFLKRLLTFVDDLSEATIQPELELMLLTTYPADDQIYNFIIDKYSKSPKSSKAKEIEPGEYTLISLDGTILHYEILGVNDAKTAFRCTNGNEIWEQEIDDIKEMYRVESSVIPSVTK